MKVIVFIDENDLTDPKVFSSVETFIDYAKKNWEHDNEDDLRLNALRDYKSFADATSWTGWVEIHAGMPDVSGNETLPGRMVYHMMLDQAMSKTQVGHSFLPAFADLVMQEIVDKVWRLERGVCHVCGAKPGEPCDAGLHG